MGLGREQCEGMERTRWVWDSKAGAYPREGVRVQTWARQAAASCFRDYLDGDRHLAPTCLNSFSQWPWIVLHLLVHGVAHSFNDSFTWQIVTWHLLWASKIPVPHPHRYPLCHHLIPSSHRYSVSWALTICQALKEVPGYMWPVQTKSLPSQQWTVSLRNSSTLIIFTVIFLK